VQGVDQEQEIDQGMEQEQKVGVGVVGAVLLISPEQSLEHSIQQLLTPTSTSTSTSTPLLQALSSRSSGEREDLFQEIFNHVMELYSFERRYSQHFLVDSAFVDVNQFFSYSTSPAAMKVLEELTGGESQEKASRVRPIEGMSLKRSKGQYELSYSCKNILELDKQNDKTSNNNNGGSQHGRVPPSRLGDLEDQYVIDLTWDGQIGVLDSYHEDIMELNDGVFWSESDIEKLRKVPSTCGFYLQPHCDFLFDKYATTINGSKTRLHIVVPYFIIYCLDCLLLNYSQVLRVW
jgi:hypothetical protein